MDWKGILRHKIDYANQNSSGYPTTASTLPNTEDVNLDKTLNYGEGYYQYRVKISANDINEANVGKNYIYSVYNDNDYTAPDGTSKPVRWYQFRIPVRDINREAIGGIQNLNSIRFMRMFMKGFKDPVFLRFARLELVRGEWRKYTGNTKTPGEYTEDDKFNTFQISAVNIEENSYVDESKNLTGVNYVLPPNIDRVFNLNTVNQQRQNEQSLVLNSCGLPDGNFNAAYRSVSHDVRMYNRLQMFVHGHATDLENIVGDDDVKVFYSIRYRF
jgi:cell surface protein SprA